MHSNPITVGSLQADANGVAAITFTMPKVPLGEHQVVAIGQASGAKASAPVTVVAGSDLPNTGASSRLAARSHWWREPL